MSVLSPEDRARKDLGQIMEILLARVCARFIKAGDWVIDAGACGGLHTRPMSRLVGTTGKVFAYEPNFTGRLAEQMRRQGLGENVEFRNVGLGNTTGRATFYRHIERSALSSLIRPADTTGYVEETINIVRLDDENIDGPLSFIKLDIEGGEFNCLRGAETLLSEHAPLIIFENGRAWPAAQFRYTKEEFFEFFGRHRYHLTDFFGSPLNASSWRDPSLVWYFVATTKPSEIQEIQSIGSLLLEEVKAQGKTISAWPEVRKSVTQFGKLSSES
jgi:FkbM family methyltransferase